MKYITFTVPCYNSQDYMRRCIDSLLPGGEDVEILIVNDGSTDATGEIADEYAEKYPEIIRVIHKKNGGHGSGVNAGLKQAAGRYFKVVDSDDWLNPKAYKRLLTRVKSGIRADLFICNYTYNHLDEGREKEMDYKNIFPEEKLCGWNDMRHFKPSQYLIMHALMFRTQILRRSGVILPEHTFYVDNLFTYQPLPYVKKIYYMDINLYQYYLGREDQSVNEQVLMKRIDQQIKVTKLVSRCVELREVRQRYPKLAVYMRRNISVMMAISSIHLLLIGDEEAMKKRRQLWESIKTHDRVLYYQLRFTTLSGFTYLPGCVGKKLTLAGYRMANRVYQFQ